MTEKKLLVFHQGALGDLVVAFPSIRNLRNRFSLIHGICRSSLGKLACRAGIFDRAFSIESAVFSTLFAYPFDSKLIDFLKPYDASIWFSFSKDLEAAVRKQTSGSVFRISPRPEPSRRIHVAYHIEKNLLRLGLSDGLLLKKFDAAGRFVEKEAVQVKKSVLSRILLHIGSGSPRKNWPLDRFKAVYDQLRAMDLNPVFLLGPAERHRETDLKGWAYLIPQDLIVLHECLKNADAYIGNDSGVTHLSAYLQLPTVAVFGPSDPLRWHPVGPIVRVVVSNACNDFPCFETGKSHCEDCFEHIPPDSVVSAFLSLFPQDNLGL